MNSTFPFPTKLRPIELVKSTTIVSSNPKLESRELYHQKARELASIKERLRNRDRNKKGDRLFQSQTLQLRGNQIQRTKAQPMVMGYDKEPKRLDISQFWIGQLIGRGAAATAKMAIHKPSGALVCVKTLQRQKVQANLDRFIHGLKNQMCMDHPNVAKVYGLAVEQKHVHVVMEYCMDGDLRFNLYDVRSSQDQGRQVLLGITRGLKYLHDKRIQHRDLKLQNVLMVFGTPKISDFDLSVHTRMSFFPRKTICGSPAYFSPEMIHARRYDKKADIWCLGIIFYEVLCGYFPFLMERGTLAHHSMKEPPRTANLQGLELVKLMLEVDEQRRVTVEGVLSHEFLRKG